MKINLREVTIGVELEATILCADRRSPVDVPVLIESAAKGPTGAAALLERISFVGEAGLHQGEMHCGPLPLLDARSALAQWTQSIRSNLTQLGVVPYFSSVHPHVKNGHGAETVDLRGNPRCRAILAAIDQFYGVEGRGLELFRHSAAHNALQFHIAWPGFTARDFFSPIGVAIVNAFSRERVRLWTEFSDLTEGGHRPNEAEYDRSAFWNRFVPGRGPSQGPHTVESLVGRWTKTPRLVSHESDAWRVDLGLPNLEEVCRTALYGTVWDEVRLSPGRAGSYKGPGKPDTIELRFWGALPPEHIADVIERQIVPILSSIEI